MVFQAPEGQKGSLSPANDCPVKGGSSRARRQYINSKKNAVAHHGVVDVRGGRDLQVRDPQRSSVAYGQLGGAAAATNPRRADPGEQQRENQKAAKTAGEIARPAAIRQEKEQQRRQGRAAH